MPWVALGLGSSIDAASQLASCLDALLLRFQDLSLSSVFESEPVGFEGNNFLNMAVGFETELPLAELKALLQGIEDKHGRDRAAARYSDRTLDIDILLYGDRRGCFEGITLPRPEVTENAFVLWPLSQIAGKRKHPGLGLSYRELWAGYDKSRQRLWPVDFSWHGRMISRRARGA